MSTVERLRQPSGGALLSTAPVIAKVNGEPWTRVFGERVQFPKDVEFRVAVVDSLNSSEDNDHAFVSLEVCDRYFPWRFPVLVPYKLLERRFAKCLEGSGPTCDRKEVETCEHQKRSWYYHSCNACFYKRWSERASRVGVEMR